MAAKTKAKTKPKATKTAPTRKGGGVKGPKDFAKRFGGGDPVRYLAFRVQTSLRSSADPDPTIKELAERMDVPTGSLTKAIELLKEEKRIKVRKHRSSGETIYSA